MAELFYSKGLRFDCARCSKCCRGEPGYIFLSQRDLRGLLKRLMVDFKTFYREYCTLVDTGAGNALSLRDIRSGSASYDCIFWKPEGCVVYEDRPVQCATYPFWATIVATEASWQREARACPGIEQGAFRSRSYIEERLLARRKAGTIVLPYGANPECYDENTLLGCTGLGPDAAHAVSGEEQNILDD